MARDPKEFGIYIRELRKQRGLTLVELYKKSGVSQPYLSQIENGKATTVPSPTIIEKLADPLGVQSSHLMLKAGYYDWFFDEEADMDSNTQDLGFVLHQKKVLYGDIELTEHDKKMITLYIDALVSERPKKA